VKNPGKLGGAGTGLLTRSPAPKMYFPGKSKAIEMKNVVYEPIAILAGGCVVFVLCWFYY
jgi:hypothetical protein